MMVQPTSVFADYKKIIRDKIIEQPRHSRDFVLLLMSFLSRDNELSVADRSIHNKSAMANSRRVSADEKISISRHMRANARIYFANATSDPEMLRPRVWTSAKDKESREE